MKKYVKNFWSLNVDEALVANELMQKNTLGKNYEVFFPINSQLPDVDLIVFNKNNQQTTTIQVKSSQSYLTKDKKEKIDYWVSNHVVGYNKINPSKVDFFIFTCFYPGKSKKQKDSRTIVDHYIVFNTKDLKDYVNKHKKDVSKESRIKFSFYIWPEDNQLYDDAQLKEEFKENDYKKLDSISDVLDNYNKIIQDLNND